MVARRRPPNSTASSENAPAPASSRASAIARSRKSSSHPAPREPTKPVPWAIFTFVLVTTISMVIKAPTYRTNSPRIIAAPPKNSTMETIQAKVPGMGKPRFWRNPAKPAVPDGNSFGYPWTMNVAPTARRRTNSDASRQVLDPRFTTLTPDVMTDLPGWYMVRVTDRPRSIRKEFCGNAPGQAERTRTPQAGLPRPRTDGAAWPPVRLRGTRIPLTRESRSPGPGPATPGQRTVRLRHLQIGCGRPAVSR